MSLAPKTRGWDTTVRAAGARIDVVRRPLRWAFALFVLSIPFESIDTGLERFTFSKMAGYLMLLVALIYPRVSFRRFPPAGWFFTLYILIVVCMVPFQRAAYLDVIRSSLFRLVQMLVLFWISYNLLRYQRMAVLMLGAFATSCAALAVLNTLGVATESVASRGIERSAAFGRDPNGVASMFAVGLVATARSGVRANRKG